MANTIKSLAAQKERIEAKIAAIEKSILQERTRELASLPAKYGFPNAKAFIKALKQSGVTGATRMKRAVITDETRAEVKKMIADKKTGQEISKALQISLPSVQNIKKALGLVSARKKK